MNVPVNALRSTLLPALLLALLALPAHPQAPAAPEETGTSGSGEVETRIRGLVDRLGGEDLDAREAARRALVEMGPRALPLLESLQGSLEAGARHQVETVLRAIRADERSRTLVLSLDTEAWPAWEEADGALREGGIASVSAILHGIQALSPRGRLRAETILEDLLVGAAQSVARHESPRPTEEPAGNGTGEGKGGDEAAPAPDGEGGPGEGDAGTAAEAATLPPEVAGALDVLRMAGPQASWALSEALIVVSEEGAGLLETERRRVKAEAEVLLTEASPPGRQAFLDLAHLATPALVRIAGREGPAAGPAEEVLRQTVARRIADLADSDPEVRLLAERALFRFADRAVEPLSRAAEDETAAPHTRAAARHLLHRIGWRISEPLLDRLGATLEGFENLRWDDRRTRVAEVERLGGPYAILTLRTIVVRDPSLAVKVAAAYGLARLRDPFGIRFLERAGLTIRLSSTADIIALRMDTGVQYLKKEDFPRAEHEFLEILKLAPDNDTAHYNLACTYSLWSDLDRKHGDEATAGTHVDQAIEHLERAIAGGFRDWKHIRRDPDLDPIREDPRFQKILDAAEAEEGGGGPEEDGGAPGDGQ